jgi:hypothetical protein
MLNTSIGRVGSAARVDASANVLRRNRKKTATAATSPRHESDGRSTPRGGWLINRLLCGVMGHRRLITTGAARILPNGRRREMFLCHACDGFAWRTASRNSTPKWSEVGV